MNKHMVPILLVSLLSVGVACTELKDRPRRLDGGGDQVDDGFDAPGAGGRGGGAGGMAATPGGGGGAGGAPGAGGSEGDASVQQGGASGAAGIGGPAGGGGTGDVPGSGGAVAGSGGTMAGSGGSVAGNGGTGGTPVAKRDDGLGCQSDDQCKSGFCTDSVCCNARCDGACLSCGTGSCTALTGEDPGICSGTRACTSGGCKLKDKQPCNSDTDCASGACRVYHLDEDGDTFGRTQAEKFCGTAAPGPSYVTLGTDCCDKDPQARPNQSNYFLMANACGDFNYDCNGRPDFAVSSFNPATMVLGSPRPLLEPAPKCEGPAGPSAPCGTDARDYLYPNAASCGNGLNEQRCAAMGGTCVGYTIGTSGTNRILCR